MRLYLVRHGKAEEGGDDAARRLTAEGREAVQRVASALSRARVRVERIEHSGLIRAEETAEILGLAVSGTVEAVSGLGSSDNVVSTARRLEGIRDHGVMLVGHVPFMERLASYLLAGDADARILHFHTGTVACLSDTDGQWMLEWFLPPHLA